MKDSKAVFFGPAVMITAAFIGPGTVLTASQAGAKYGFSLLWAVVFATLAAIVLQEMAGRLGIATGNGLAQAIGRAIQSRFLRVTILTLVLIGILIGNSAFQTGNLLGSAAGVVVIQEPFSDGWRQTTSSPNIDSQSPASAVPPAPAYPPGSDRAPNTASLPSASIGVLPVLVIAAVAWSLILLGRLDWIQGILTFFVALMSVTFLVSAVAGAPSLTQILHGLVPRIPPQSEWVIIGLIGTTVVPYNLFLHASATANRWPSESVRKTSNRIKAVQESAKNTVFSIGLGGLITAAILITAAVAFGPDSNSAGAKPAELKAPADIAVQLEPALGSWARLMFGLGLFAAGLTSAVTAPVAAAYTVAGCVGWPNQLSDWRLKVVASIVLLIGFLFALVFGNSPQDAILMAQVANGFLLPVLAILLLVMLNRVDLVTRFHNRPLQNVLAITAILIVILIATRQFRMVYPEIRSRLFQSVEVSISCDVASPLATEV